MKYRLTKVNRLLSVFNDARESAGFIDEEVAAWKCIWI